MYCTYVLYTVELYTNGTEESVHNINYESLPRARLHGTLLHSWVTAVPYSVVLESWPHFREKGSILLFYAILYSVVFHAVL